MDFDSNLISRFGIGSCFLYYDVINFFEACNISIYVVQHVILVSHFNLCGAEFTRCSIYVVMHDVQNVVVFMSISLISVHPVVHYTSLLSGIIVSEEILSF